MKKFILLLLLSSFCFGQNEQSVFNEITDKYHPDEYIYVIDGIVVNQDSLKQLYPKDIFSLDIMRQESMTFCVVKSAVVIVTNKIETTYDLIVTDIGIDSFLAQQNGENYYSLEYLKSKNRLYTSEWNNRVMTDNPNIYDMQIDYNSQTQYGLAFEYKLYQFFKFIEQKHSVRLI